MNTNSENGRLPGNVFPKESRIFGRMLPKEYAFQLYEHYTFLEDAQKNTPQTWYKICMGIQLVQCDSSFESATGSQ